MSKSAPQRTGTQALSPAWRRLLASRLLAWFAAAARDLPWRQTSDLYAIWISEIMLQQTQVATVIPYWRRFIARFPNVASLAAADERDVLRLWEGLGYYRRARQLHAAARAIASQHGGRFPDDYAAVRALPGIGRYTAGAILSIGRDARLPILEANTIRLLSRLTAYEGDPATAAGQRHLWTVAEAILPRGRCGTFNQALMELGSTVCTPRTPRCAECPLSALCEASQLNRVSQIPRPPRKKAYEAVTEIAVVIRRRGRVLVRQCQAGERWAGLWDFPRFAIVGNLNHAHEIARAMPRLVGLDVSPQQRLATLRHGVTRFRITLHCYAATPRAGSRLKTTGSGGPLRWVEPLSLADYPLSTTGRKISRLLVE
jgi:A/G-specific adenine glycosylase